jgi:hypothetical protein
MPMGMALRLTTRGEAPVRYPYYNTHDETGQRIDYVTVCRSIIAARAMSVRQFGRLCIDPATEMLLDLYWRESEGRDTCLTSLCWASKVSEMTGRLRLATMEEQELVERMPHPFDRRSTNVRLTALGREKMECCFGVLVAGFGGVPPPGAAAHLRRPARSNGDNRDARTGDHRWRRR